MVDLTTADAKRWIMVSRHRIVVNQSTATRDYVLMKTRGLVAHQSLKIV